MVGRDSGYRLHFSATALKMGDRFNPLAKIRSLLSLQKYQGWRVLSMPRAYWHRASICATFLGELTVRALSRRKPRHFNGGGKAL
jgi:hypothetical protein